MRFSSRLSIIFSFLGFNEPLLEESLRRYDDKAIKCLYSWNHSSCLLHLIEETRGLIINFLWSSVEILSSLYHYLYQPSEWHLNNRYEDITKGGRIIIDEQGKVNRWLANHSLSSTASQGTSNIPFPWFLLLGCNRQAQDASRHISKEWKSACQKRS